MFRLFRVFIPISTLTLFIAEILLMISSFLAASYVVLDVDPTDYLLYDGGILAILAVSGIFVLALYFNGLYSDVSFKSKVILLHQLFLVTGLTFVTEGLIASADSELRLPIRVMVAGSCLSVAMIFTWRLIFSRYANQILGHAGVLLVGTDPVVAAVGSYLDEHPQSGFRVAGYVQDEALPGEWLRGIKNFGEMAALPEIVRALHPSRIVVGTRSAAKVEFAHMLEDLRYAGENIQEAAETYEKVSGRVWVRGIQPAELIYTSRFGPPQRTFVLQRFFHPIIAMVVLILLLPVIALTWLYLHLRSTEPVLRGEIRTGLHGALFIQYRFHLDSAARGGIESRAMSSIRRFHLDGLPQLWNVLKGDMALVGPCSERPEFVDALSELIPYYRQRYCVRPGMTGWAQIRDWKPVEDTFAKLEYDLYYIKNMAMSLDTLVIFQTLRSMFLGAQ